MPAVSKRLLVRLLVARATSTKLWQLYDALEEQRPHLPSLKESLPIVTA